MLARIPFACLTVLMLAAQARGGDGNRLVSLDETSPYHVGLKSPRLTTPQWVGEAGVEAVVVLAVDDLKGNPAKYETFLRPIIDRLKEVEGRGALSIMTNSVAANSPEVKRWLGEGVSLDIHSVTHPCPLLQKGDFAAAARAYHDCVDQVGAIEGNRPAAFRMPCCDSQNTVSPRFFSEMFNKTSPGGRFLTIDTSVFNLTTSADKALPRELTVDPDGRDRFRKFLPFRSFVNVVENYPYPFVINKLAWEFPCMVPSDWEGQNLNGKNSPKTLADMKAAVDATVLKQGVFCLVFHPHGWMSTEQVVALIDQAKAKYGRKVKFLNFREAQARIDAHMLAGQPLRAKDGGDNGVRMLDLNDDGFMDFVVGNASRRETRIWDPAAGRWKVGPFPVLLAGNPGARFGIGAGGSVIVLADGERGPVGWRFDGSAWLPDASLSAGLEIDGKPLELDAGGHDLGARLRDLDGDGVCELIVANARQNAVFGRSGDRWTLLPIRLPDGARFVDRSGTDAGLRLVDVDGNGRDDVAFSNDDAYGLFLFESMAAGWPRKVTAGKAGEDNALPRIVRGGTDNGAWFSGGHLWVQNEDTAGKMDLVDRRSFKTLLEKAGLTPKKAAAWLRPETREKLAPVARLVAGSAALPESARVVALGILGPGDREMLAGLVGPQAPGPVRLAAISALARSADARVPEVLLAGWSNHGPVERLAVLDALLARADWTGDLISSLEDTCTPPEEVDAAYRRRLVEHRDPALRERARAVFPEEACSCCAAATETASR
ncbi:VCBS repeat-containing protein [Isosphaeraceae bacterium EP7]